MRLKAQTHALFVISLFSPGSSRLESDQDEILGEQPRYANLTRLCLNRVFLSFQCKLVAGILVLHLG